MTRCVPFCLLLLVAGVPALAQVETEEWLRRLRQTIEATGKYDAEKRARIDRLHRQSAGRRAGDPYEGYLALFEEYASFKCDSAFAYAVRLQQAARQSKDPRREAYAGVKLGFTLLSSGMFKEAFDSLRTVDLAQLSPLQRAEYYTLMARCYYDLADYNLDQVYAPLYNARAGHYLDSALVLFPDSSYQYGY